jgi:zinc protease
MNTLLGGSFTSRLNDNLREQHGYTYGAGSGFIFGRSSGVFLAGSDVQADATAPALGEFLKELERIRVPPTDDEAERARNYLALGYAEDFETTRQIAAQIVEQVVYELPEDVFNTFVPKVLAVDANEMSRVAKAHIDPLNLAIVVVGDRAKVEQPLRDLGLGSVKVMSIEDVMGPAPAGE